MLTDTQVIFIKASNQHVFSAWTQAAAVREWFGDPAHALETVEVDPRPHGRFMVVPMAKTNDSDLELTITKAEFLEVAPAEELTFAWSSLSKDGVSDHVTGDAAVTTLVHLQLFSQGDNVTKLVFTQSGFTNQAQQQAERQVWQARLGRMAEWCSHAEQD